MVVVVYYSLYSLCMCMVLCYSLYNVYVHVDGANNIFCIVLSMSTSIAHR